MNHKTESLDDVLAEYVSAAQRAEEIRYLVSIGSVGASALHTAQWQVDQCQRRIDRLRSAEDMGGQAA